ncbi:MAG: hypothetical protein ACLFV7_11785 [Phycisphaerae bacterium]
MTTGDWIAIAVVAVFALMGSLGLLTWLFRMIAGAVAGAAVLVLLSISSSPALEAPRQMVNDGSLVPGVREKVRQARDTTDRIANPPPPVKPEPPKIVIVTGKK